MSRYEHKSRTVVDTYEKQPESNKGTMIFAGIVLLLIVISVI